MDHALEDPGAGSGLREEWLKYVGLPVEEGIQRTFGPLGVRLEQVLPAYRSFKHTEHEHLIKGFDGIMSSWPSSGGRASPWPSPPPSAASRSGAR